VQGFDAQLFESRTSLPLLSIENKLRQAEHEGLIERRQLQRIRPERARPVKRFLNRLRLAAAALCAGDGKAAGLAAFLADVGT
jgi:hypothetical protein